MSELYWLYYSVISDPPSYDNATDNPVYALDTHNGNRPFTESAKFEAEPCPLYEELDNLGMLALP